MIEEWRCDKCRQHYKFEKEQLDSVLRCPGCGSYDFTRLS